MKLRRYLPEGHQTATNPTKILEDHISGVAHFSEQTCEETDKGTGFTLLDEDAELKKGQTWLEIGAI